jgi:plastocyanin
VLVLSVAGCAPAGVGAAAPATRTTGSSGSSGSSGSRPAAVRDGTDPACTKATKAKIIEKADHTYAFSPDRLTIQRGAFLAVTNKSGRVHALVSKPDAGIVTSVLDLKERQVIQFPEAGTFQVESASATHRAVLEVTVSGESGCGAPKPKVTIGAGDVFQPAKLSVAATENFAVVNESGTAQTVICDPDPGGNGDNSRLDAGETQLLAIDQPGRYTCTSVQHPSAKVIVTVKAA